MNRMHLSHRQKMILAIASAMVMVLVSFAGFEIYFSHGSGGNIYVGPKINIALPGNLSSTGNANVTEYIQIMGVNPSYFPSQNTSVVTDYSIPSQGYLTLFNMTFFPKNGQKSFSGFMNFNKFFAIMTGWQRYYQNEGYPPGTNGQEVSLQVEATLSLLNNGNLSVYSYYNNIPFNPLSFSFSVDKVVTGPINSMHNLNQWFNNTGMNLPSYSLLSYIPYSFNLTPSFDKAKPTYVSNINASVQNYNAYVKESPNLTATPCYIGTKYVITNRDVLHGPFPLISIHDNTTAQVANNFLVIVGSLATSSVTLCMTSDQTGVNAGGGITDQMSTNPSWGSNGSFDANGQITSCTAYPLNYPYINGSANNLSYFGANNTTAIIYISNVTFTVTHYNIYYTWKNTQGQCFDEYLGNMTSVVLASIYSNNGTFTIGYGSVPIEYYYVLQNATKGQTETSLGYLAPGTQIRGVSVWDNTTGYSNGTSELKTATDALQTFAAGLGVGLALICVYAALNGVVGDASEPAVVNAAVGLLDSILTLSISLLTDFSSISFSTDSNFGANLYSINSQGTHNGYSYYLIDYQSSNPITFNANGYMYSYYGPSNFVVAS